MADEATIQHPHLRRINDVEHSTHCRFAARVDDAAAMVPCCSRCRRCRYDPSLVVVMAVVVVVGAVSVVVVVVAVMVLAVIMIFMWVTLFMPLVS